MATGDGSNIASESAAAPGDALRAYAINELAEAIACLAWRGARLHRGVHLARKSMRRTRAALALGRTSLGRGGRLVDRELRRIIRSLSKLRDAQALVEALHRLAEKDQTHDTHTLLERARRAAARQRMLRAREAVRDDATFLAEKRTLLAVLAAAVETLPWTTVSEAHMVAALQRSTSKAKAAGKRVDGNGRDEDWHRWRRRARRLSQQHRALGDRAGPAQAMDKALAISLGEAQDFALLIEHCADGSPFNDVDRQALRGLAEKGLRQARARIAKPSKKSPA